jgi:hypothetical protein
MGKIIALVSCLAILTLLGANDTFAGTGKCVVTDVAGNKMVIECTQDTKGFDKGSKIKIKSEKKRSESGK